MASHALPHTNYLWVTTKDQKGIGTKCLLQAHGFRTVFGQHNAQTLPAGMTMYFYVDAGYSLVNSESPATAPCRYSVQMKHVMEGKIQPRKTVDNNNNGYTDHMMSKDDWFSYIELQDFLNRASNLQGDWDIVTVRNRTGTLYVNLSDMIGVLHQNNYTEVHLFICRSSLAHPFQTQWPGGTPGNQQYPIKTGRL